LLSWRPYFPMKLRMPRQWQHQPRHLPLSRFRMKYFSACGSSFDLLCSFWFSEVDEGLYFVAEFRTDYSVHNDVYWRIHHSVGFIYSSFGGYGWRSATRDLPCTHTPGFHRESAALRW
jgi:hypothetical protein